MTSIDTIAGGAGDDELVFIDDVTMLDAAFTNVTSVETIKGVGTDDSVNVTLGQYAAAAGVTTVNLVILQQLKPDCWLWLHQQPHRCSR